MSVADGRDRGVTGGGAVPPPDAPIEITQPLRPDAGGMVLADGTVTSPRERALANERVLPPFNPPKGGPKPPPVVAAPVVVNPQPNQAAIEEFFGSDTTSALDPVVPAEAVAPELPPLTAEDRLRMPAASNSDSPARGRLADITPPKGDKFEGIARGGFGDFGDAQYEPLNGAELLQLSLELADRLVEQIRNDLRFSMALTYPRVRVRLALEVTGHAEDVADGFSVEKFFVAKDGQPGSTPIDVARLKADRICFVVDEARGEITDTGDSDAPPDQIRDELGLPKPRKQIIERNGGQSFVDIGPESDSAAVTR